MLYTFTFSVGLDWVTFDFHIFITPFEPRARRPVPSFVYRRQTLVTDKKKFDHEIIVRKTKI
jgi:hypothetical protein